VRRLEADGEGRKARLRVHLRHYWFDIDIPKKHAENTVTTPENMVSD
jgi:hypothetical protein